MVQKSIRQLFAAETLKSIYTFFLWSGVPLALDFA